MADELVESAEFGRKKKDEEEPILVAQRFSAISREGNFISKTAIFLLIFISKPST